MFKFESMNFPNLRLPDGRIAEKLGRDALAHELLALGVPDVKVEDGKILNLRRYDAHLRAQQSKPEPYSMQDAIVRASMRDKRQ